MKLHAARCRAWIIWSYCLSRNYSVERIVMDPRDAMYAERRSGNQTGARPNSGRSVGREKGATETSNDRRPAYALRARRDPRDLVGRAGRRRS